MIEMGSISSPLSLLIFLRFLKIWVRFWGSVVLKISYGFELMGVVDVGSNGFWNGIDLAGVGVFDEGADENDEGGELLVMYKDDESSMGLVFWVSKGFSYWLYLVMKVGDQNRELGLENKVDNRWPEVVLLMGRIVECLCPVMLRIPIDYSRSVTGQESKDAKESKTREGGKASLVKQNTLEKKAIRTQIWCSERIPKNKFEMNEMERFKIFGFI
ncbi:hypothetical protein V6N12_051344 [Hibiscus sabdariffa]|uniref:Uncharacterized protein n=1 Tax=Hibiscus sabdariffa TaxID=183260 RepID=A0ABR2GF13_9ROSI